MNFFGGSNCGDMGRDCGNCTNFGNCGNDCCSLIFLILLLQCCGGCNMKGINVDCGTILFLLLLSNCGCK